jgi:hypothetical protein
MRRIVMFLVVGAVFCLFVPLASAAKKPGGRGGGPTKVATQVCDMTGDVAGSDVEVGIAVGTYGPDIDLTLSNNVLLGYVNTGTYRGEARVLKETVQSSLYVYFRMDGTDACEAPEGKMTESSGCDYTLVLTGGTYNRKQNSVHFGLGSNLYLYDLNASPPHLVWGEPGDEDPQAFGGSVEINNFTNP